MFLVDAEVAFEACAGRRDVLYLYPACGIADEFSIVSSNWAGCLALPSKPS